MKKVAVIDSGSGGVNVLKYLFKNVQGCQFLYLADDKNSPYGEKGKKQLKKIGENLVIFLQSFFNPDIIIIACNTLTSTAIELLRKKFPDIVFIGCEPAIKPACKKYDQTDVLLLATPATIKHNHLIGTYPHVRTLAIKNLPKLIDENLFELDCLQPLINQQLKSFKPKAIVLGCTHFEAIRNQILRAQNVELFSSCEGIAKRLQQYLDETEKSNEVSFMCTQETSPAKYYHYFNS